MPIFNVTVELVTLGETRVISGDGTDSQDFINTVRTNLIEAGQTDFKFGPVTPGSAWENLCRLKHEMERLQRIDRTSFFGRLDILEYYCEKTHQALGLRWRKFQRYGNIVEPAAFTKALDFIRQEAQFSKAEFQDLHDWLKGISTPDCAVGAVMLEYYIKKHFA